MGSPRRHLLACLSAGVVLATASVALAAGTGTIVVKPAVEAWYRSTPACALPTGCVDVSGAPSEYAPDTLHIGVNVGVEEARTYLQLDLTRLPAGTKPAGGTLLLPVATGPSDGTRAPGTAAIQACAVKAALKSANGSFATPPEADCKTASVPALFVPATGTNPAAFTVALAALANAWQESATPGAVALLPAADTAPPASWHVALSDRDRRGDGVVPITASLAFVSAAVDTFDTPPPFAPPPPFEPAPAFVAPPAFDTGTSFAAPPAVVDQPAPEAPAPAPVTQPAQQVVPVASVVEAGFRYPAVFLLPLLLVIAATWVGRALTRDLVTQA